MTESQSLSPIQASKYGFGAKVGHIVLISRQTYHTVLKVHGSPSVLFSGRMLLPLDLLKMVKLFLEGLEMAFCEFSLAMQRGFINLRA